MSEPSPAILQAPIDVAVACDIKLGDYARQHPGTVINVDPDAISDYLQTYGRPFVRTDELLFVACSTETTEILAPKIDENKRILGSFSYSRTVQRVDGVYTYGERDPTIHVAVVDHLADDQHYLDSMMPPVRIQANAVHELRHAIDYFTKVDIYNPSARTFEEQLDVIAHEITYFADNITTDRNKQQAKHVLAGYTTLQAVNIMMSYSNIESYNPIPVVLAVGGLYVIFKAAKASIKTILYPNKTAHEEYLSLPREIAARKAELTAHRHRPVITVTKNQ